MQQLLQIVRQFDATLSYCGRVTNNIQSVAFVYCSLFIEANRFDVSLYFYTEFRIQI